MRVIVVVRPGPVIDNTNDGQDRAAETVQAIGARIRELRSQRRLTLQALASMTGLSASLLSLVERGKTSPSIGTLVSVAHALGVHTNDLIPGANRPLASPVTRRGDQRRFSTTEGATRMVIKDDRARGVEIAINEYNPGGRSADSSLHHGDSTRPHRICNEGERTARALWVNLDRS
jgi:transcriptional regulator with XRE-family HTH domain